MRVLRILIALAIPGLVPAPGSAALPAMQTDEKVESRESSAPEQRVLKRLILKDGSSLATSKYEIKGNRVRYFSSERREWEEVPYSLIDWSATDQYGKETTAERQARLAQSKEDDAQQRGEEEAKTPLIAPGIRLPETGGVLLLDQFEGRPELNRLQQNGASVNKNRVGNILRGAINPIASTKQTIELAGLHARVQSHVGDPQIYVALDSWGDPLTGYTPETAKEHFRIVRCQEKNGKRIVGVVNIAVYGKVKRDAAYVKTKVEPVSGHWVKVTPATPLPPGEYALVELLGKEGINTFVWDFGVNPASPENVSAQKQEPEKKHEPLVLQKRRKLANP